jgi:hypothetical protein
MNAQNRHDVADTDRVPPHVRLCRQILRESLAHGVTSLEFVGAGSLPAVNRQREGVWQPYMQVPPSNFAALVRQLKVMADLGPDQAQGGGTIHVRSGERDADVALTTHRTGDGVEMLTLRFPGAPPALAAT